MTVAACLGLVSCGGGAAAVSVPTTSGARPDLGASIGNWTTFAHDYARSGRSDDELPITKDNVAKLSPRWQKNIVDATIASPLVYNGRIYITTLAGNVLAFDTTSGDLVWRNYVATTGDHLISMTPTISDGLLIVGSHTLPSQVSALDATTGATRWQTPFAGYIRGEPVVANGVVYIGEAGGDSPACLQGGVYALDEQSGKVLWTWHVDQSASDGGAQWGPISYDGGSLYVGTGNTCLSMLPTANALVKLDLNGVPQWNFTKTNSTLDNDFGGAPMLLGGNVYSLGKDGYFYALSAADGHLLWKHETGDFDEFGGFGSPTTDGTTLVVPTGSETSPRSNPTPGSHLLGLDLQGNVKWSVPTKYEIPGYAAIGNGMAFVGLDETLAALDVSTGQKLWTFSSPQVFYASPVLVSSGLYAIDEDGNLYAFDVATTAAQAKARLQFARARLPATPRRPRLHWTGSALTN